MRIDLVPPAGLEPSYPPIMSRTLIHMSLRGDIWSTAADLNRYNADLQSGT